MTSVAQQQYEAAAKAAENSREEAAKAFKELQGATDISPAQLAYLSALQETAKIDALHLISHDLNALRDAVDSLESR